MKQYIEDIKNFLERLKKHHVSEYSAQCAYYIILSFIPSMILIFTLVQFVRIGEEEILYAINNLIPDTLKNMFEGIVQEVYFKSIGTLSISIIFTLWSSGKGFFAICKGLHSVYEIKKKNNFIYFKLKSTLCIIVFSFLIMMVLILTVFGGTIIKIIEENFTLLGVLSSFVFKIRNIILFFVLFLAFAAMYKFIPNHKVKFKDQLWGAAFSTIGWYGISYGFSIYIKLFTGISNIYGSLTTIMLLMMWVYLCMYFILLGAEINKIRSEKKK